MISLVLGGVRSGKSEVAERLAGPGPGTYLATGLVEPGDADFAGRVARHQARRPPSWVTVEEPRAVPALLARLHGPVLLDALGTWIANEPRPDIDALVDALVRRAGDTVIVSEEVGLGVHPVTEVGRQFADRLGEANRRIAEVADRCLLVVAGRVIDLPAAASGSGVSPARPEVGVAGYPPSKPFDTSGAPDRGFQAAVAFLTPVGGAATPNRVTFNWFPLVGALLGLVLGVLWSVAEHDLGPLAGAALVVAADLALTGALHFDGLLDSADGLLPHLGADRRLAVMADPHVGAFGIAAGAATLLLRTTALAAMGTARPLLLAALWTLSRTAMAVTALTGRYARDHGLASSFLPEPSDSGPPSSRPPSWVAPAVAGAILALVLAALEDVASIAALLAAGAAAAGVAAVARRRIGGFTGDTLGAGGIVAETVGLLVAVAVLSP